MCNIEQDWLLYEKKATEKGFKFICGVDEAGRGPLAGPVCAAAVILPINHTLNGLNDSKKLSEKKRELLFEPIKEQAISYSIAFATVEEIEQYNILQATYIAMMRAIDGLSVKADYAMIDGNRMPPINIEGECIIKGDSLSQSIAAASILAKVTRDRYMVQMDSLYPEYNFLKHKGYGTKEHREVLQKLGPSPIHRMSFLKKILG